jgi:hypothetical protein
VKPVAIAVTPTAYKGTPEKLATVQQAKTVTAPERNK